MKNTVFFGCGLLLCSTAIAVQAQQNSSPSEIAGKITSAAANSILSRMASQNNIKGNSAKAFYASLDKQAEIISAVASLNPPIGFDVHLNISPSSYVPQVGDKRYRSTVWLNFFEYYKNKAGKAVTGDEGSAKIEVESNPPAFMTFHAGHYERLDEKLKIPQFFQKIPVTDSTADYVEYNFRSYGFPHQYGDFSIRVVRKHNKPIFIPFTRREYIQYLIALQKSFIHENEERIINNKREISEGEKTLKDKSIKEEYKTLVPMVIRSNQEGIEKAKKDNDSLQKKIDRYNQIMSSMPQDELSAGANVDMKNFRYSKNEIKDLVPYGRSEGDALFKVNPDYYDNLLPPNAIQAIMVTYWYHNQFCPDFLRKEVKGIFEQLDYHKLKESMK